MINCTKDVERAFTTRTKKRRLDIAMWKITGELDKFL